MFHTHGGKGWGFSCPYVPTTRANTPANTKQVWHFQCKNYFDLLLKIVTLHTTDTKHKYYNKLVFEAVADYVPAYDRCNLYMICKQTRNTHF